MPSFFSATGESAGDRSTLPVLSDKLLAEAVKSGLLKE
jgi:hypothetical protein